jgi:hypothetical protein
MFYCKFVHLYGKQGQSYINAKTHLRMSTHPFEPNKKKFFTHKQKNKKQKAIQKQTNHYPSVYFYQYVLACFL